MAGLMDLTLRAPGEDAEGDDFPHSAAHAPSARYFEPGSALTRVLEEAPYLARCSDNKTAALVRPRDHAIRFPYMQINRRGMVSWLIFDLDHENSLIWDSAGLPAPNFVVRNRANGHSHLYYAIAPVCTTEKARDKPIMYMKAIYEAFALRLQADPDYHSGPVAKTPGHRWWITTEYHNHTYDLGELAEYVDLQLPPWPTGPKLEDLPHSRHCILFEQLRYYAYSTVNREREKGSLETFSRLLESFAHNRNRFARNGFSENLPLSSIRATVRSVARWTWMRYSGSAKCWRGAMELDPSLPLAERQGLAAKRTHQLRHKETESKIRAACRGLQERGEALSKTAIASLARVSRQTVARYSHVLNEVATPASVAALDVARSAKAVPVLLSESNPGAEPGRDVCNHSGPETALAASTTPAEMQSEPVAGAGDRGAECNQDQAQCDAESVPYGVRQVTARFACAFRGEALGPLDEDSS
ncbi:replication initiation protein (plasmid) [Pseudomonas putida]|uniref:Replication initiation protein n=2 Tax=Pseudomonas putida TaxID=303 RepID=A0A7D5W4F7_PSEPU|nr:replication initiation protein [Pseudomonas putida]